MDYYMYLIHVYCSHLSVCPCIICRINYLVYIVLILTAVCMIITTCVSPDWMRFLCQKQLLHPLAIHQTLKEHPLHDCYTISDNPATQWPPGWTTYSMLDVYDGHPLADQICTCMIHYLVHGTQLVCPCTTNILCHQWGLCARPSAVHAMKKLGRTWVWENPKLQILNWHLGTHNILHLAHQTMSQCGTIACSFISVN